LVRIGERIESGIKNGKIQATASAQSNNMRKPVNNFTKKKEGDTNVVA
jgi:hypothetical protein